MQGHFAIFNSQDTTTTVPATSTFRKMSTLEERKIDQTGLSNIGEVDVSAEFIPIHITTTGSIMAVIGIMVVLAILWRFCTKKNLKQINQLCCHRCECREYNFQLHTRPYEMSGESACQRQSVENSIREANLRVMGNAMTPQRVNELGQPGVEGV